MCVCFNACVNERMYSETSIYRLPQNPTDFGVYDVTSFFRYIDPTHYRIGSRILQ